MKNLWPRQGGYAISPVISWTSKLPSPKRKNPPVRILQLKSSFFRGLVPRNPYYKAWGALGKLLGWGKGPRLSQTTRHLCHRSKGSWWWRWNAQSLRGSGLFRWEEDDPGAFLPRGSFNADGWLVDGGQMYCLESQANGRSYSFVMFLFFFLFSTGVQPSRTALEMSQIQVWIL